jgi:hypothetical protein
MAKGNKTTTTAVDPVGFIRNQVTDEQKKKDSLQLIELMTTWTDYEPKMWGSSIIGFGRYHYKYESGREGDWFLAGFSPRKNNLSIYITAGFDKYDDIMSKLGKYKTGASCLYVKKLSDIDIDTLKVLVEKSVSDMKKRYA